MVGNDAEVEYEEVRRDQREAHLNENRRAGGCHDAVVRGGGDAHAENDAADHGQNQADEGCRACELDDGVNEDRSETCDGDAAGNHACNRAGNGDGDGALCTSL